MVNEKTYLSRFEAFQSGPGAKAPAWLRDLRKDGAARFAEMGFPGTKDESWRFTRVRPLLQHDFAMIDAPQANGLGAGRISALSFADKGCHRVVFVNGHFSEALSDVGTLPKGVRITGLGRALAEDEKRIKPHLGKYVGEERGPFAALNTAHIHDGAFVDIPDGVALEEAIHLVFVSSGNEAIVAYPRNLIIAGDNTRAAIVESYVTTGDGVYFNNVVSEFVIGAGAVIEHYKVQKESKAAYHIGTAVAQLGEVSRFKTEFVSLGGALVRNDVATLLVGENIDATLNGLYVAGGHQHVDNHTNIEHAKPHCDSHELYKGILAGRAKAVFNGKIHVHPDAQKTDAKQSNGCMLLSDDAQLNTNPQLEIYADDVKCTHGAVVGQIDDNAVFYLRSRGISERDALHMLVFAFANDVLERIEVPALRKRLETDISEWLNEAQPVTEGV